MHINCSIRYYPQGELGAHDIGNEEMPLVLSNCGSRRSNWEIPIVLSKISLSKIFGWQIGQADRALYYHKTHGQKHDPRGAVQNFNP